MTHWLRRAAIPLLGTLLLAGCEFTGLQSTLDPAGPIAQAQLDLFLWSYWLSWLVIIGVFGAMAYALVRFRTRASDPDRIPTQFHGSTKFEIALTIAPVLIVIAVAVPTVQAIFATETRAVPEEGDVIVNVTGYQWWWRFEYPEHGVVTANEMHVPVGRRVIVNLESADVLHAFWVPRLAGKRDLIPNQNNQLWFSADETGEFYGQCAELCLGAHAYMKFRVHVVEEEEFGAWVDAFEAPAALPESDDQRVRRGHDLFATKGCTTCHTVDGYRGDVRVGSSDFPNLTNFGLRTSLAAGVVDNGQENLETWLRNPQIFKPGNYMPRVWSEDDPNADEEIAAVAAYLLSLGAGAETEALAVEPDTLAFTTSSLGGDHGDR
ncbi:MAG: cytochrome c oxidase subunit II [Trueperaceae bacterium]